MCFGPDGCDASRNLWVVGLTRGVIVKFHGLGMLPGRLGEISIRQEIRRGSFRAELHIADIRFLEYRDDVARGGKGKQGENRPGEGTE